MLRLRDMIHWSFEDPSYFEGTEEERLTKTRIVRDQIQQNVKELVERLMTNFPY